MLQPVTIRLPAEMVRQIEALRATRLDAPDKSTLIRELLAKALQ
jgi:Arc/MetJ-type ribon-helix-helix transcriptional regulator